MVPRVDDEHTVVASSSCWDADLLLRTDAEEEDATCFLGYDVFLRTTEAPPPGAAAAAAAAAAAPRSPCRMVTSSSDGGTLELEALRLTHLLIAPWRPNREGAMVDASVLCVVNGKTARALVFGSDNFSAFL